MLLNPSIKCVCGHYIFVNADKYYGIIVGAVLFEHEVLLRQQALVLARHYIRPKSMSETKDGKEETPVRTAFGNGE